ncbi:hypothetical protein MRX96_036457 [Rhipicephalus microplus]
MSARQVRHATMFSMLAVLILLTSLCSGDNDDGDASCESVPCEEGCVRDGADGGKCYNTACVCVLDRHPEDALFPYKEFMPTDQELGGERWGQRPEE